jgi:glycosyltransferase involved in cell wall biosynthesis
MSRHVTRSLVEHYGIQPGRVRCVFAGGNVRPPQSLEDHDYGSKRVLFVGRAWERKGGLDLMSAFEVVRCRHPDATLIVAGCRPDIAADGVTVLGDVPPAKVAEEYRRAAIFCMPTLHEPFGVAFVEALTYGVPVIATSIGAVTDIVQDGETGLLIEPHDTEAVAESISLLLGDPDKCRRFGELGRRRSLERYSWPRTVGLMTQCIREVLAIQASPTPPAAPPAGG